VQRIEGASCGQEAQAHRPRNVACSAPGRGGDGSGWIGPPFFELVEQVDGRGDTDYAQDRKKSGSEGRDGPGEQRRQSECVERRECGCDHGHHRFTHGPAEEQQGEQRYGQGRTSDALEILERILRCCQRQGRYARDVDRPSGSLEFARQSAHRSHRCLAILHRSRLDCSGTGHDSPLRVADGAEIERCIGQCVCDACASGFGGQVFLANRTQGQSDRQQDGWARDAVDLLDARDRLESLRERPRASETHGGEGVVDLPCHEQQILGTEALRQGRLESVLRRVGPQESPRVVAEPKSWKRGGADGGNGQH